MLSHKQSKLCVYIYVCTNAFTKTKQTMCIYIRVHKCFHINKANYVYIDTFAQMLSHKQSKLFVYIYVYTNGFT